MLTMERQGWFPGPKTSLWGEVSLGGTATGVQ